MKNIVRILGLVLALGLVSFTGVQAWGTDNCFYSCSDGNPYHTYATYSDCCSGDPSALWCPPGESPSPGWSWGGLSHPESFCS